MVVSAKRCSTCKKPDVPIAEFSKNRTRPDGLANVCKTCERFYRRRYRSQEHVKAKNRAHQKRRLAESKEFRVARLVGAAKKRSKDYGLAFELDKSWAKKAVAQTYCPITGIEFDLSRSKSKNNPLAPSLDQIEPSGGYTKKNTRMICWWANCAKSDMAESMFKEMIRAAYENYACESKTYTAAKSVGAKKLSASHAHGAGQRH